MEPIANSEFSLETPKRDLMVMDAPGKEPFQNEDQTEGPVLGSEETECDLGLGIRSCELKDENGSSIRSRDYLLHDANTSNVKKYGSIGKGECSTGSTKCPHAEVWHGCSHQSQKEPAESDFPGSSIGSNLQQQKDICREEVQNVFIHKMIGEIQQDSSDFSDKAVYDGVSQYIGPGIHPTARVNMLPVQLRRKFFDSIDEVDRLKSDLTARCRQLESKHKAVEILQVQLEQAYRAHKVEYDACQDLGTNCRKLEQELDQVKWEFEARDYQVGQSQDGWRWRLEKVERENRQLQAALHNTQTQLKCAHRENSIVEQEKQELLCLMQLSQDERHASALTEADTYHLTKMEMSVLGSCNCDSSSSSPSSSHVHPCRCAWSLVNSRREITHLQNRVRDLGKRNEDNLRIVDLYRNAFEDQLEKNKKIFVTMVNKQLKPTVYSPTACIDSGGQSDDEVLDSVSRSYMFTIIDMLRDRTEELFHKRLSTQLLADKIYQLEKQVTDLKLTTNKNNNNSNDLSLKRRSPTPLNIATSD